MRGLVATALLLTGCNRVFALLEVAGADAGHDAMIDSPMDAACTNAMYGKNGTGGAGLLSLCVTDTPQGMYAAPSSIDTTDPLDTTCTYKVSQTKTGADELCVIAAADILVSTATRASGSRPLVLLATNSIVITGSLDVSSVRGSANGAGANDPSCPNSLRGDPGSDTIYGAGGGGGTFQTSGGDGGNGSGMALGGKASGSGNLLTYVRGGCRGGNGGLGAGSGGGGAGAGGGAIYLIAGSMVEVNSNAFVNASGESGGGGSQGVTVNQAGGGGGGAGSGGLIAIDAPTIQLASGARLVANGGGGGGSGPVGGTGTDGKNGMSADPSSAYPFPAAGGASDSPGGAGANANMPTGSAGASGSLMSGGGGGGGGAGFIKLYSPTIAKAGALISPPP